MIFGEQYAHNIADVAHPTPSLEHRWIIDGWMKLIVPDRRNRPAGSPLLSDVKADRWEGNDLASRQPDRVKALHNKRDAWWTSPAATC